MSVCTTCKNVIPVGREDAHRTPCALCLDDHTTCQHVRGWVCPQDGCHKLIDIPEREGSLRRTAVNSHLKSHGMAPLDVPGSGSTTRHYRPGGGGTSGGGWIGDLAEGIGEAIGSIFD